MADGNEIEMNFPLDATECEQCGEAIWLGWDRCPHCGRSRQPGDIAQAHLYRARRDIFGPIARDLSDPGASKSKVPLTDQQYLSFVNGSGILSVDPAERMREAVNAFELETPESTRSVETRKATHRLAEGGRRIRRTIRSLSAVRPSGEFADAHPHLLEAWKAYLGAFREAVEAPLSWRPEDAQRHAEAVQEQIDEAASQIEAFADEFDRVTSRLDTLQDTIEDRMFSLVFGTLEKAPQEITDIADLGIGSVEAFLTPRRSGYDYFADLLETPYENLPNGMPQVLYLLALLVGGSDDPAGVLDRARLFKEVMDDALGKDRDAMLEAAVRAQESLNEASSVMVTLVPQSERIFSDPDLPADALRDFVADAYARLTEGCFRRVTDLLLFALFITKGQKKGFEEISEWSSFGDKYEWLDAHRDTPATTAALEGVEKIVRNSEAHCEFHLEEDGIRFVQRDFKKHRKTELKLTDDELADLLRDLQRTILALSVAAQVFQCDHMDEISTDLSVIETPKNLRGLYLELLLAVSGLQKPEITQRDGTLEVRAELDPLLPPQSLEDYLKGLFFLRELYPDCDRVALHVDWQGEWYCSVEAPSESIKALGGTPAHLAAARAIELLLSSAASSITLPARTDAEKLEQTILPMSAATLHNVFETAFDLVAAGNPEAEDALAEALEASEAIKDVLRKAACAEQSVERQRTELVRSIEGVEGLGRTVQRVQRGALPRDAIARAKRRASQNRNALQATAGTYDPTARLA